MHCPTFAQTNHSLRNLFLKYNKPPKYSLGKIQKSLYNFLVHETYQLAQIPDFSFLQKILPRTVSHFEQLQPKSQESILKLCQENFFARVLVKLLSNSNYQLSISKGLDDKTALLIYLLEELAGPVQCQLKDWEYTKLLFKGPVSHAIYLAYSLRLFESRKNLFLFKEKAGKIVMLGFNPKEQDFFCRDEKRENFFEQPKKKLFIDVSGLRFIKNEEQLSIIIHDQDLISHLKSYRVTDGVKPKAVTSWQNLSDKEIRKNFSYLKKQIKSSYGYLPNLLKKKINAKIDHFLFKSYLCTTSKKCNISIRRAKQLSHER